jgi:hypothetical protein
MAAFKSFLAFVFAILLSQAALAAGSTSINDYNNTDLSLKINSDGSINTGVKAINPATFVTFQVKMTGSAVQLPSNALVNGLVCTAKGANAASVEFGGAGVTATVDGTGNGYIVPAGGSISAGITNSNVLYAIGTNNDVISCNGN